eukprot:767436-Hanusia_phi.AAC.2
MEMDDYRPTERQTDGDGEMDGVNFLAAFRGYAYREQEMELISSKYQVLETTGDVLLSLTREPMSSEGVGIEAAPSQEKDISKLEGGEPEESAPVRRNACCPLASWLRNSRRKPGLGRKKRPYTVTVETLFESATPQRNSVAQCSTPFPTPFQIDTEPLFPRREGSEGSETSPLEDREPLDDANTGVQHDIQDDTQGPPKQVDLLPREVAGGAAENGATTNGAPQRPKSEWVVQLLDKEDSWHDTLSMSHRMAQRIVGISVKAYKGMRVTLSAEGSKAFDERLLKISGGGVGTIVKVLNHGTISRVAWDTNPEVEHCYRTGRFGQFELCQFDSGRGETRSQNFTEFMPFTAPNHHMSVPNAGAPSQSHGFFVPAGSPGQSHDSDVLESKCHEESLPPEPAQLTEASHHDGQMLHFSTVREWTSFGRQPAEAYMVNEQLLSDERWQDGRLDAGDVKKGARLSFQDSFVTRELRMQGILPPSSLEEPNPVLGHTARLKRIYDRNEMGYFTSITTSRKG